jgi:hypothetical protein
MPAAWIQRIASECNIDLGKIESYWNDAVNQAEQNYNMSKNDQNYWRYVVGTVKHRLANEGCREMTKGDGPPHQSRALKGLITSILSEYETDRRGTHLSDQNGGNATSLPGGA